MELSAIKDMLLKPNYLQKTIFTLDEAALYLGISKSAIYKKTSKKLIPFCKTAKLIYFEREKLDAWILSYRVKSLDEIQQEVGQKKKKGGNHGK